MKLVWSLAFIVIVGPLLLVGIVLGFVGDMLWSGIKLGRLLADKAGTWRP